MMDLGLLGAPHRQMYLLGQSRELKKRGALLWLAIHYLSPRPPHSQPLCARRDIKLGLGNLIKELPPSGYWRTMWCQRY